MKVISCMQKVWVSECVHFWRFEVLTCTKVRFKGQVALSLQLKLQSHILLSQIRFMICSAKKLEILGFHWGEIGTKCHYPTAKNGAHE